MKKVKKNIVISTLLFISLVSLTAGVCADESPKKERDMVELEIEGVYEYGYSGSYLVQLTKKGGKEQWVLPMIIGGCEANAAVRAVQKVEFPRPLTHDLFTSIFEQSSLELKHIIITKLEGGTFFAVLVVQDGEKTIEIDARPSDGINIAMRTKVPIYATQEVLDEAKEVLPDKKDE